MPRRTPPDLADPAQAAAAYAALLPERVLVHPLTRVGVDADGRPALLAHLELRDRFDQHTRALGVFRIVVTHGLDEVDWEIDLRDPVQNARLFDDLVTRTYALTLSQIPAWVQANPRAQVSASFTFHDGAASRTITDSARIRD